MDDTPFERHTIECEFSRIELRVDNDSVALTESGASK